MKQSGVHVHPVAVRFGDCDPAGIVYFPRFFDYFHQTMETWFGALGHAYDQVIVDRRIGFPAVHTEADFRRPSRFGEVIDVTLRVARLGTKSLGFAYEIFGADEPRTPGTGRVVGATTCVVMDLDPTSASYRRGIALPDDLRRSIEVFGVSGAEA